MKNSATKEEIIAEIQRLEIALSKLQANHRYDLGMLRKLQALRNKL